MAHLKPHGDQDDWTWEVHDQFVPFTHDIAPGMAAHVCLVIRAGGMSHDIRISKVIVSLETAPGGGKTVTFTVTDGTNTMTVAITGGADVYGVTTTNAFDLDVSAEDLTVTLETTAGTASGAATILLVYNEIDI